MRRVRDRRLPDPFRAWIDRAEPLPPGVTVLPRTISVSADAAALALIGIGCVGLGVPCATLIATGAGWLSGGGLGILVLAPAVPFCVLIWVARRLWRTIGASRDQKAGALWQGVLVGPAGVLVRLAPDRCYPIPMDRFMRAQKWSGGGEDGVDFLRIETR